MSDEKSTYLTFPFSISYILYDGNRGIDNLWHRTRSFNIATKLKHDYPHLNLYAECKTFNNRFFKITTHKSHFEVLLTFLSMEYYDVQSAINEWHQDKIINNNNFSVVYGKFIYICTVENDDVIILSRSISNEKKRHKNTKRLRGLFGAELPSDRLPILSSFDTKEVSGGITTTNGLSCKNKTCKGKRYNTKNSGIAQYSAQRATNFNPINEHKGYKKHHSRSLGDDFLTLMGLNGAAEWLPKQEYELQSITHNSDGLTCQHCGRPISRIASILGKQNKISYHVGLDCVKKLINTGTEFSNIDEYNWENKEKEIKKWLRLVPTIQKQYDEYNVPESRRFIYWSKSKLYPGTFTINWQIPTESDRPYQSMWYQGVPEYCKPIFNQFDERPYYSDSHKILQAFFLDYCLPTIKSK